MKELYFSGNSLDELRTFPVDVRREAGFQLDRVQHGLDPSDWKTIKMIGSGVREIRIRCVDGAYRVIYTVKLIDAVYVLHAFQKKTQKTPQQAIDIAKKRLNELRG